MIVNCINQLNILKHLSFSLTFLEPELPFRTGCFNSMNRNLDMGSGCLTKHPFKTWLFGYTSNDDVSNFLILGPWGSRPKEPNKRNEKPTKLGGSLQQLRFTLTNPSEGKKNNITIDHLESSPSKKYLHFLTNSHPFLVPPLNIAAFFLGSTLVVFPSLDDLLQLHRTTIAALDGREVEKFTKGYPLKAIVGLAGQVGRWEFQEAFEPIFQ